MRPRHRLHRLAFTAVLLAACSSVEPPSTAASSQGAACLAGSPLPKDVEPPVKLELESPPPRAPRGGPADGYACVHLTVDDEGRVSEPEVVATSSAAYGRNVVEAVEGWRFEPATRDGKPVTVRTMVFVHYRPVQRR